MGRVGRVGQVGGWLFKRRTWLPLQLAVALLFVRWGEAPASLVFPVIGGSLVVLGELMRLWAVRHIGVISRTRAARLGPVVSSGPFRLVRNPIYLGNMTLWMGFALCARLPWMVPVVAVLLGLQYHAIVQWEEGLLEAQRGPEYTAYAARVPRWIPRWTRMERGGSAAARTEQQSPPGRFSWGETFFSERGTLLAIATGCVLMWLKWWLER